MRPKQAMPHLRAVAGLVVMSAAGVVSRAFARRRTACAPAFAAAAAARRGVSAALRPVVGGGVAAPVRGVAGGGLQGLGAASPAVIGAALGVALRLAARRSTSRLPIAPRGRRVATAAEGDPQSDVSLIDFRVGEIVSCERHPDSDKLLVEKIDIGEEAPRQICSGIGGFFTPEDVIGRRVVIVANLKGRKMAGTMSEGMLLCASKREEEELKALEIVEAPADAAVGERIVIEVEGESFGEPAPPNKVAKKKLYEQVAPELRTDADGKVCFKDLPFMTTAGPCTATALPSSVVS